MSQKERVLKSLRHAGPAGVTQVDWLRHPTPDGGPPITRVAARVQELRDEGLPIVSGGTRHRCAVYVLREAPVVVPKVVEPGPVEVSLFDPASLHQPRKHYEEEAA